MDGTEDQFCPATPGVLGVGWEMGIRTVWDDFGINGNIWEPSEMPPKK